MSDATIQIAVRDIEIGERVGFFDADHAVDIATSFIELGQTTPIQVSRNPEGAAKPWRLVAGRHRICAASFLGWSEIDAKQVADASAGELLLRLLELSENLDRRSYRPLERAIFIEERARLEEALDYPDDFGEASQVRAGRARQSTSEIVSPAKNWRERTATAFGVSLRTIELYREIYRAIVEPFPDLAEALNFHKLGERFTHIYGIAKLIKPELRRKVIETIIADPELNGFKSALIKCGERMSNGNRALPQDRAMTAFQTAWEALPKRQKAVEAVELARYADLPIARKMYAELQQRRGIHGGGNG